MKRLIAICVLLLAIPLFAGDESMPAYILVKAVGGFDTGDPMVYQSGDPVDVMAIPRLGGKQVPPTFIEVVVTDATVGDVLASYCSEWRREIEWDVLASNLDTDTHTLKAYVKAEHISASGLNRLTRKQVESYLNNWGAEVLSIAPGEVTFSANIYGAIKSNGFWGRDVQMLSWSEIGYDKLTGIHRVKVDYTGYAIPLAKYAGRIVERGCKIVQNRPAQHYVTFDCSRENVRSQFKADVKSRVDGIYSRKRWRFMPAAIDAAMANGGSISVTRQELQDLGYIRNRLLD
jgi:hypothetical protein